jgi:hypothetical protein
VVVDKLARLIRLANDCKTPMFVFANWYKDMLYVPIEQVNAARPPLHLVELDVKLLGHAVHLRLVVLHHQPSLIDVLRYQLHEVRVENVHFLVLLNGEHEVLEELEEEEDESVVQVHAGFESIEITYENFY